ncbi:hypothetical protein STCU_08230 [Strigomonas culicis]|nr:hypothetical protein STCU_08230 [Strigomonas culicis]|eukprot:EPY22342.1 hypothetical protein STCU_08230 [Strigomonas culicis]
MLEADGGVQPSLLASLLTLDGSESSQSGENIQFCQVFAKDKILQTFATPRLQGQKVNPAPRMRISGEDLYKVLLITKNNSLGFPFSFPTTTTSATSSNEIEIIGWSLQSTMCLLNHSCSPNAEIIFVADSLQQQAAPAAAFLETKIKNYANPTFELEKDTADGTQWVALAGCMALRALRDITLQTNKNNSDASGGEGEELTISYINLEDNNGFYANHVMERNKHLLEQYRFLCRCGLCEQQRAALRQQQQQQQRKK